jgi:hypothetical protein
MDDGRTVDFAGKRRLIKTPIVENNEGSVRLDFINGETRIFKIPQELLLKMALHGAEQKLGDEVAGIADIEDMVEATDELMLRLSKGEWSATREKNGNSIAGASILVRALVELTGKKVDQIRESLATKTQEEKMALRKNSKLAPIVARLEQEKSARREKKTGVDSDALLESLTAPAADPSVMGTADEAQA